MFVLFLDGFSHITHEILPTYSLFKQYISDCMDPGPLRLGIGGTNIEAVAWKLSEYPDGLLQGQTKMGWAHR